jgi:membrane-associated phospholipid phosphatase
MSTGARLIVATALWLAALAAAFAVDRPVAEWVHRHGLDAHKSWTHARSHANTLLKLPGEYYITAGIALIVGVFHRRRWRGAAFVAVTGVASGVNGLVKWVAGRHRPAEDGVFFRHAPFDFHPFAGGLPGLFGGEKNLCFPSGHACLAFATAAALSLLLPRWRWAFYIGAALVAAERVLENAHYVSDTVAAAALGVAAAHLLWHVFRRQRED